jgi:hypothetical protein
LGGFTGADPALARWALQVLSPAPDAKAQPPQGDGR